MTNVIELNDYKIVLDESLLSFTDFIKNQKYSKTIILVDENTQQYCLPILKNISETVFEIIEIKSGEQHKNITTCSLIWQQLLLLNCDRNTLFINLGGGVIGDMGGFTASCYKRGIDFINIPTTLLSQVDSSIGGKLGIDFEQGKNLIGLFKNPKEVIISTTFLKTLPVRQYVNGWAEITKHALINDAKQWEKYLTIDIHNCNLNEIIYESLLIKKHIVEIDPFEKGKRKILNFGHTIGHAIESYSLEYEVDHLLHGEAIAIGMICEAFLSYKKMGLAKNDLDTISSFLLKLFPKKNITHFKDGYLLDIIQNDKKNKDNKILSSLLTKIGECVFDIAITNEEIIDSIEFYNQTT
jgi:3-dehydroquinate synthase